MLHRCSSTRPGVSKRSTIGSDARPTSKPWEPRSSPGGSAPIPLCRRSQNRLATRRLPSPASPLVDALLEGVATRFTDGYRAAADPLRNAAAACTSVTLRITTTPAPGGSGWPGSLRSSCGTTRGGSDLATSAAQLARESGTLGHLPIALTYSASVHIHAGEFTAAAALIEEADGIVTATGHSSLGYASALLLSSGTATRRTWKATSPGHRRTRNRRGEGRALGGRGAT